MSIYANRWLLPEGIHELLPNQAQQLEQLRRNILDSYRAWGYELVFPPFIEFLDSLLSGTGADLDLQTFKLTDQLTGRMMGVRADITPQVARIDAHQLQRTEPTRLCYSGTVLHTKPDGFSRTRAQLQTGAELYGYAGISADMEIFSLMLETLRLANIANFSIDMGHVGIYRGLMEEANLPKETEQKLFDALQIKSPSDISQVLNQISLSNDIKEMLENLVHLQGNASVLSEAKNILKNANQTVQNALQDLEIMLENMPNFVREKLHLDLAELSGYSYHTGLIFAGYVPQHGAALIRGGRYDHVGEAFGRARPATGFSTDLMALLDYQMQPFENKRIFAPEIENSDSVQLAQQILALRSQGQTVICELPQQVGDAKALNCTHQLVWQNQAWVVVPL
jgi:ATP phosphoribosyltransferase regulatory subunit